MAHQRHRRRRMRHGNPCHRKISRRVFQRGGLCTAVRSSRRDERAISGPPDTLPGSVCSRRIVRRDRQDHRPEAGLSPMVLAVHPSGPHSLKDLIALAKSQPGRLNYGMGGTGSITHLTGELFKLSAQVNLVAVPYKSIGLAVNDLLGAQVQAAFPSLPPTVAHARAGRLRVLAVAAEKRVSVLPEVPTFEESGVSGVVVSNWFGLMGPARLPATIVSRLHAGVVKAVQE